MRVHDPNNLLGTPYTPGAHNTTLLHNIKKSLKYQYRLGNSTISRFMFTPQQEQYIMQHLFHTNRPVYEKIMDVGSSYTGPYADMPKWWNQSNSKNFRSCLR